MLKQFIKENKISFLLAIIYGSIAGGTSSIILIIIHRVLKNPSAVTKVDIIQFILSLLGYIAFYVLSDRVLVKLAQDSIATMRNKLSKLVIHAPLEKVESMGLSKILTIIEHDVNKIGNVIDTAPKAIVDLSIFLSCMGYLIWLSPTVFIIMIISTSISIASYYFVNNLVRNNFKKNRSILNTIFENFQSLILGLKELQLSHQKRNIFITNHITKNVFDYKNKIIHIHSLIAVTKRSIEVLLYLFIGALVFIIPKIFDSIEPSTLQGFVLVVIFLIKPIESLLSTISKMPEFSVSMAEIKHLSSLLETQPIPDTPLPITQHIHTLKIENISYTYFNKEIDDSFTLGPLSTTIHSGKVTYIIGGNGSGKTTFGKLLSGLYLPQSGELQLNNTKITHDNLNWYREHISAIFSDYYLFDHFLELSDTPKEKIQHYIDALHLSHKVSYKHNKFSTLDLSSGQRKRLALILTFLQDRPIYIFDEWASDQDPEFKKVFYTQILPDLKKRGKMIIVITHDDQYFQHADTHIRLTGGHILNHESSTHEA